MNRRCGIIGICTETPLHAGTGQNVGAIDLPVQRERHTGLPMIVGSSLKGCLRSVAPDDTDVVFGARLGSEKHFAGAVSFTDCRLLALPVRSLQRLFLWVTCPQVLQRLQRDLHLIGADVSVPVPQPKSDNTLLAPQAGPKEKSGLKGEVVLEDLILKVQESKDVARLATTIAGLVLDNATHKTHLERAEGHTVVVTDRIFGYLARFGTQVVARNQLTPQKTSNNLWYTELVPPDTWFYSVVMAGAGHTEEDMDADTVFDTLRKHVRPYLQIGGGETVGLGWCALRMLSTDEIVKVFESGTEGA